MVRSLLALGAVTAVVASDDQHSKNPIRRVVTMLQMMQNKVAAEAAKKEKIFDAFMCYCANADQTLGASVAEADKKIPLLESGIEESISLKSQLSADLKQHQADRSEAKEAIGKATGLRDTEAKAFAKTSSDLKTNLGALSKAIPAISNGMSGFLQTNTASVLRQLSIALEMTSVDREMLTSFLSAKTGYSPASGEIVGILKTMEDEMSKDLSDATASEKESVAAFDGLVAAKTKEINALSKAIESKMGRVGELGVKIAQMKNDLEDTKEDLAETQEFLGDLEGNCKEKKEQWAMYQKMQGQEMLAIADTIKVLNDDDALELFKKTLPGSASALLQVGTSSKNIREKAINVMKNKKSTDPRVDLLSIALKGGKVGFGKIIKMIDELVVQLKNEQVEDDTKKQYCSAKFDELDDKKKSLEQSESDLETSIDDSKESISTLKVEIEALDDGIRALDKEVEEATDNRQKEHAEFSESYAASAAAVDLLKFAKNRLNKFYNPSQYKAPPKRELSEEQQITVNMGGTLAPTEAPGGIAGTGISFAQVHKHTDDAKPPAAPEADMSYKKKGEESGGVIALIDNLINDVEKENLEMELEEKDAQKQYERIMDLSSKKRVEDSKSMTDKTGTLAETEESLVNDKQDFKNTKMELMNTHKVIGELHSDCDFLVKYYDARKEARTGEIESMGKARDVLNGADYSF